MFAFGLTNIARHVDADEREYAADVDLARQRCGWSHDYMARQMDLTPAQWSNQRAGREHISAFRLLKLGWSFELALFTIRAARHGVDVLPPGALRDFFLTVVHQLGLQQRKADAA